MSQVSFTTAKALKDAGLPQPKPEPGQFWYKTIFRGGTAQYTALCVLLDFGGQIIMQAIQPRWDYPGNSGFDEDAAFAPTVSDILPLIGNGALIKFRKDETGQIFECNIEEGDGIERLLGYHETNPAEAAAMAWLRLNENDQYASDWLDSVTNETPSKTFVKPGAPGE